MSHIVDIPYITSEVYALCGEISVHSIIMIQYVRKVISNIGSYLLRVLQIFQDGEIFTYSAAIAYYTIVAVPPLLVLFAHYGSQAIEPELMYSLLYGELSKLLGETGISKLQNVVMNLLNFPLSKMMLTLGFIAILFSCTTIFMTMKVALNRIFIGRPSAKEGFWQMIKARLVGLALIVGFLFVLISSFLINTLITLILNAISEIGDFDISTGTIVLAVVIPVVVLAFIFGLLFRLLPDHKIPWRYALLGGAITSILFTIGKDLISYYIGQSELIGLLDAAGSIIVVTIWLYYSAVIFFVGATITATTLREEYREKAKAMK